MEKQVIIAATEEELDSIGLGNTDIGGREAEIVRDYTSNGDAFAEEYKIVKMASGTFNGVDFVLPSKYLKPCD